MFMALVAVQQIIPIIAWTEQELILLSQDSGLCRSFQSSNDANGNSRVQLIDWFSAPGVTGSKMPNLLRRHRRTWNTLWRHGNRITFWLGLQMQEYIASKVGGLEGSGDPRTGISTAIVFLM